MSQVSPRNGRNTSSPKSCTCTCTCTESAPDLPPRVAKQNARTLQRTQSQQRRACESADMFEKIQGSLMVVAVLAAGATYQAGLSPPGGFWQADDNQGHIAGMPVLKDIYVRRYNAFFYCNATSFIMSLVIIIVLMHEKFYHNKKMVTFLKITMMLDMFGFMGAFAAGSCREVSSSIYLFLLMGFVFIFIISFALHFGVLPSCLKRSQSLDNPA